MDLSHLHDKVFVSNVGDGPVMDVFHNTGRINKITLYGGFVEGKRLSWTVEDERDVKINGIHQFIDFYYDILDLGELKTIAKEMAEGKFKRESWHVLPDDYKPIDEIAITFDLPKKEVDAEIKEEFKQNLKKNLKDFKFKSYREDGEKSNGT